MLTPWPCMRWSLPVRWGCSSPRVRCGVVRRSTAPWAGKAGHWQRRDVLERGVCWCAGCLAVQHPGERRPWHGNMLLPAGLVVGGGVLTLTLSPALILGWGPVPALGIAGAGVALLVYYSLGSLVLLVYLCSGQSLVQLALAERRLQRSCSGRSCAWVCLDRSIQC